MNSPLHRLFFILTWIFVFFLFSVCSGMVAPKLHLETTVFVAFAGEDLTVGCSITKHANQSIDTMTCYDPFKKQIYHADIPATVGHIQNIYLNVKLKNLAISGEYFCQYQTASVYWFLQVRDGGYKEPRTFVGKELVIVTSINVLLLVFSVAGSVYVFRGNWITKCGKTAGKQNQNREERNNSKMEEDSETIKAPSTSFYSSLQPRSRSIYDVLEHSGANKEQEQRKTNPDMTKPPEMIKPTTQFKDDVFESVYENF